MKHAFVAAIALAALAALGCSSSSPAAPADAGSDAAGACSTFTDGVIAIDPAGPDTQVHAASAFGGDRVFVVYDRARGAAGADKNKLDVFLAAFRCDGTAAFAPVRVSDDDGNDVDPEIAVRGERVVVTWAADSGAAQDNLSLHVRTFDRDGVARGGSRVYSGPRAGKPVTGNAWMAQIATTGSGFALTGAWGVPEAPAFQVFGARLDAEGAPLGGSLDVGFDAALTQTVPDVVAVPGAMIVAWQSEPNQGNGSSVEVVRVDDGATTATKLGALPDVLAPSLASAGAEVWLAAGTPTGGAKLWHVSASGATPVDASGFGAPAIALATVGGAIVGTTIDAGHRQLKLARFDAAGALTNELVVVSDVPPYPIELTTVDRAGVFFLAYQEGTSPAFRAKGRFLDLR